MEINKKFCKYWVCDSCGEEILACANTEYYLTRNLKLKKTCKKCSLKKQVGVNNPFYGKKHTSDTINKIVEKKKGKLFSHHMSKKSYQDNLSKIKKEKWGNGDYDTQRKKLRESMIERHRNGEIKSFNRSKAEFEIIELLEKLNFEVIPNFRIDTKIYDLYLPKLNLLIEYHGNYWHCNPEIYAPDYFNKKKKMLAKEIWEYDNNKLYLAINNNYNCLIIWEKEYKQNKNIIKEKILNYEKN